MENDSGEKILGDYNLPVHSDAPKAARDRRVEKSHNGKRNNFMHKGNDSNFELAEFSPLTEFARQIFQSLQYLAPIGWLKHRFPLLRPRSELLPEEVASKEFVKRRGRAIETYLIVWLIFEGILAIVSCFALKLGAWAALLCVPASLRVIEIIQVTVNAALFDALSGRAGNDHVASRARMLVLAGINFGELCCCFGIIYAQFFYYLHGAGQPATGFYLSIITQLTIGYGDVYPTHWLRIVAAIQGLIGTLFLVVVVSRFVSSMPSVNEIHTPSPPRH